MLRRPDLPNQEAIEDLIVEQYLAWKEGPDPSWEEGTRKRYRDMTWGYILRIYGELQAPDLLRTIVTLTESEFAAIVSIYRPADPDDATAHAKQTARWWSDVWHWIHNVIPTEMPTLRENILSEIGEQTKRITKMGWGGWEARVSIVSVEDKAPEPEEFAKALSPPAGDHPISTADVFCGGGGFSRGAYQAGAVAIAAVDNSKWAVETYNANYGPIAKKMGIEEWVHEVAPSLQGKLDCYIGGPPCFGFSKGSRKMLGPGSEVDKIPEYIQGLKESEPPVFILENVPNLRENKRWDKEYKSYLRQMKRLGYEVVDTILWANDFGCPQARQRLFIVGTLGRKFEFPTGDRGAILGPNWAPFPAEDIGTLLPNRRRKNGRPIPPANPSVLNFEPSWDIIAKKIGRKLYTSELTLTSGISPLNVSGASKTIRQNAHTHWFDTLDTGYDYYFSLKILKAAQKAARQGHDIQVKPLEGFNDELIWREYKDTEKKNEWLPGWYEIRRNQLIDNIADKKWLDEIPLGEPFYIQMLDGPVDGASCLSFKEAALLQGFPLDYEWRGPKTAQWSMVGNAIPSVFGYYLLKALIEQGFV